MRSEIALVVCLGLSLAGCSEQSTPSSPTAAHADHDSHDHDHSTAAGTIEAPVAPSAAGQQYVLAAAPSNPLNVIEARESVQDGDEVVVFGQIGGSQQPWVDGRAMFTLVDDSLKSCDEIPGDTCPTPWDYCCETPKLKTATALVKVVDQSGQPVKTDARELLGVRELTDVIVQGQAQRDEAGNFTLLASGVYVKR